MSQCLLYYEGNALKNIVNHYFAKKKSVYLGLNLKPWGVKTPKKHLKNCENADFRLSTAHSFK